MLLSEISTGRDPATEAALNVIAATDADVILLLDVDYDPALATLNALADRLAQKGVVYPHRFALPPNRGIPTGLDLDGNGRAHDAGDAQGYGSFAGAGGMAILSTLPIARDGLRDHSAFLWTDLPDPQWPSSLPPEARSVQRLATTGFWEIPLDLPDGGQLRLLAYHAAPPAFGRGNANRNHDETAFWLRLIDGQLPMTPPSPPFVILGTANADPQDGDGSKEAIRALLGHPAIQDTAPRGADRSGDPDHTGDPAFDTADFGREGGMPGGLRVDYVLPSAGLQVVASGVIWPPADDPFSAVLATASRHRPVWVDLAR